jgi:hypothetical protein
MAGRTELLQEQWAASCSRLERILKALTVDWLTASQLPLTEALAIVTDKGLDDLRPTNWGERIPAIRVFTILINEQVHHGAEISLLRDLYRNRETLAGSRQVSPNASR